MINKEILDNDYRQDLEESIIQYLAFLREISVREAMNIYYKSQLAEQIEHGDYGIDNLDYKYLVEDLIENEPELFVYEVSQ